MKRIPILQSNLLDSINKALVFLDNTFNHYHYHNTSYNILFIDYDFIENFNNFITNIFFTLNKNELTTILKTIINNNKNNIYSKKLKKIDYSNRLFITIENNQLFFKNYFNNINNDKKIDTYFIKNLDSNKNNYSLVLLTSPDEFLLTLNKYPNNSNFLLLLNKENIFLIDNDINSNIYFLFF